ncbi:hypothetical protein SAMN05660991_02713 [Trujillonella endophytica]|uniref:Uncharacterized protein n=1 Tax=Trujillonella endophytica TaxID=673521 RepID=A0A1H8U9N3_9ACTN|nr:hypothetical protein SAMN05660991_02713 [Trujillella endophytica]
MRTALLATVVVTSCLAGCGSGADAPDGPGPAGAGPERPGAGDDELVVDALPLDAPVVLDPVPDGLRLEQVGIAPPNTVPQDFEPSRATLYGDPALADTLDGPVLLVGTSSGSAQIGGPGRDVPGEEVDLGGRTGKVVRDADRTWVVLEGNDFVEFVVGRGIDEDDLVAAARGADFASATATLAPDAVPAGLEPLVAGGPPDGPGAGPGEYLSLRGDSAWIAVVAVRADPRLAALWGFWVDDATGTVVRAEPGSVGVLRGTYLGGPAAPGRVWAEDGMVVAAVVTLDGAGEGEALLDQVVENLRVGTAEEFEAMRRLVLDRPPTPDELGCGLDGGFVSGAGGDRRWAFALAPNSLAGLDEWTTCYMEFTNGSGGGGTIYPPPPVGELVVEVNGSTDLGTGTGYTILGGVAPPGTARVTVTTADGRTLEAQLADVGPRPGERVWGAFDARPPLPPGGPPLTVTAYDAAGAVLRSVPG